MCNLLPLLMLHYAIAGTCVRQGIEMAQLAHSACATMSHSPCRGGFGPQKIEDRAEPRKTASHQAPHPTISHRSEAPDFLARSKHQFPAATIGNFAATRAP
jgi:hypothetical protein